MNLAQIIFQVMGREVSPPIGILLLVLGVLAFIAFRIYVGKNDRKRIKSDLMSKGRNPTKIQWCLAGPGHNAIEARCYEVVYQNEEAKTEKKYCYCSITEPLIWVDPTDGY